MAEYLVGQSKTRSVYAKITEQVINAVDMLDPLSFDKIQRETLGRFPEPGRNNSYLDFCHHIAKAVKIYILLIEKPSKLAGTTIENRKILDIGSGSGAFSFVCNALGHRAIGMDKPRCQEMHRSIALNYLLTQWYNVEVIEHEIKPMSSFPIEDRRFDDFALFYPNFHHRWKEQDWNFLFSDLFRCATRNDSEIYVQINKPKIKEGEDVCFSVDEFSRSIADLDHERIQDRSYIVHLT